MPMQPLQTIQCPIDPQFINLGLGNPQLVLLPMELMEQAAQRCFARGEKDFLQYGYEQGHGAFRQALAEFLTAGYGYSIGPEDVFTTNGVSSALSLACLLFTQPGDVVFVEEPTYFLALRVFQDHHLRVISIPVDEDGLVIEALEEQLAAVHPTLLYTIPNFQNPSGVTLSAPRRQRLAELSREHDFLVVADEVYYLLGYGDPPPPPMAAYIPVGRILSLGSFSKILAPGLWLGWQMSDHETMRRIAQCGMLDSGGGMNPFTSAIVREVIEPGLLQQNIEALKAAFRQRIASMDAALQRHLPQLTYRRPQGGYFFWVRFPGGMDAKEFLPRARQHQVGFQPGIRFSSQDGLRDYGRLCFAQYSEADVEEGLRRLRGALDTWAWSLAVSG